MGDSSTMCINPSSIRKLENFEKTAVNNLRSLGSVTVTKAEWFKIPSNTRMSICGKNGIFFGMGCHLVFYDMETREDRVYTINGLGIGDGIQVYTGHRMYPIIAFSEKCLNPKIIVMKYPEFERICELENGAPEGYLSLTFSATDFLISLSRQPYYNVTVWNWRTSEKVLCQKSDLESPVQYIRCNQLPQITVVQFSVDTVQLRLWDLLTYYKKCFAVWHKTYFPKKMKKIADVCWSTDGTLFVLDRIGNVYQLSKQPDLYYVKVIESTGPFPVPPVFTWYKGGILLAEQDYGIKHYKRSENWEVDWEIPPCAITQFATNSSKHTLIAWNASGHILELDKDNSKFIFCKNVTSDYLDFGIIYPLGDIFVTYSVRNDLECWDLKTGNNLCFLNYTDQITSIRANPRYPYVAVGFENGRLQYMSLINKDVMKIMAEFFLYERPITKILFNRKGNLAVTANLNYGIFFFLRGVPGEKIAIVGHIDYRHTIVDYAIQETKTNYQVYMLVMKEKVIGCSNKIVLKMVSKIDGKVKKRRFAVPPGQGLQSKLMIPVSSTEQQLLTEESSDMIQEESELPLVRVESMTFYAKKTEYYSQIAIIGGTIYVKPNQSKNIRAIELANKKIRIIEDFQTGHLLRYINFIAKDNHVTTWGYDGLVTIRTADLKEILSIFVSHHRVDKGVQKAETGPTLKYTISLGNDGSLLCTNLSELEECPEQLKELNDDFTDCCNYFSQKTIGFNPEGEYEGKNYLEVYKLKLSKEDRKYADSIKKRLRALFLDVKKEVIKLLEENLSGPEMEKINILEFYLHKKMKEHRAAITDFECEWTRRYCHQMMEAQDKVTQWMKQHFWYPMIVKRTTLFGIFANFNVENYVILADQLNTNYTEDELLMQRRAEELLRKDDTLLPWIPTTRKSFEEFKTKLPSIKRKDERLRIKEAIDAASDLDLVPEVDLDNLQTYHGSRSFMFIDVNPLLYHQAEVYTFSQIVKQANLICTEDKKLRLYFNKKFDELASIKNREMQTILEKNKRLRYVLSELNYTNSYITDPKWDQTEKPESIIKVEAHEISVTPYISPSEQLILDAKAAEAERIRLMLLADDFKERALMDMMHGVLEIRWEDTIKRDIPKPKCMLEKKPEEYNEDDLRAIMDYEAKVVFLMSERQRYKNMLEAEYTKLSETVTEGIKKFNERCRELLLIKLKVESARRQEILRVQTMQNYAHTKIEFYERETNIKELLELNRAKGKFMENQLAILIDTNNECKSASELLIIKEKQLEKYFKRDISEYTNAIQAQAFKLYKKLPRGSLKGIASVALLYELGRCCLTRVKSLILIPECIDYLKSIDVLDQYVGIPNTIDENLYRIICRHRRLKLENYLRIRANMVEQQDIESTMNFIQKRISLRREKVAALLVDQEQLRADLLEHLHNKQIQIVIKQGFVEIPQSGRSSDFKDVIVVNRSDVEDINSIIQKAGKRKLKVMHEKMIHRRDILMKEWEHKHMNMEIEDLEHHLYLIGNVKVTKEIQQYLRNKAKGFPADKGILTLDQEVEMVKSSYERIIMERKTKVDELDVEIKEYQKKNKLLDKKIAEINIDVCEQQLSRNLEFEDDDKKSTKNRMDAIVLRGKLVKTIQEQHNEILMLQTELELLRLKTYPTLKFKTLD